VVLPLIENLGSTDDRTRLSALQTILKLTESQVDWVYDVWDGLFEKLNHENSFQRSIAIMVLCNLAKSDTEDRLADSLDLLLAHTKDDKFITSRQCIQSIWKVATTSKRRREKVLAHLEKRFRECVEEKHYNLIRQSVAKNCGKLQDQV
jgi:HEAT repeat protein